MQSDTNNGEGTVRVVGRRRFLGWLGAFIGGFYLTTNQKAEAAAYGIPDEWVRRMGPDVLKYAKYIQSLRLRYITPKMVLAPHFKKRGRTNNSIPPRYMWKRLKKTLRVIDKLSSRLGRRPKELLSIYRSPRYNRAVRGRSRSQHLRNTAVDLKYSGVSPWKVAAEVRKLRRQGYFKGGVGRYSSFVHIDTRGSNADW